MRRAFLLLCVVVTTYTASSNPPDEDVLRPYIPSEGRLYIEPHLGLNFTLLSADSVRPRIDGEGDLDIYRSALGIAPLIGVTVGYQFSPTIGLEFDVSYDARNASNSGTSIDNCVITDGTTGDTLRNENISVNKDYTVSASYLALGLLGTFGFSEFFFFVGPQASIPVSSSIEETHFIATDTVCQFFFGNADASRTIVASPTGIETATRVSIRLGAGLRVRINDRMELVPRLSYDFGLTDVFTGNGGIVFRPSASPSGSFFLLPTDNSIQLNALQASLGLRITL